MTRDRLPEPWRTRYLDLLARHLTGYGLDSRLQPARTWVDRLLRRQVHDPTRRPLRVAPQDPDRRALGLEWPQHALTMVGLRRLQMLRVAIDAIIDDDVPGDILEAGVWRGGASIFMKAVLASSGETSRRLWLADSFQGLPAPAAEYPADEGDAHHQVAYLAVDEETVRANFAAHDLLDDEVLFVPGWFEDTLAGTNTGPLALIRLDGDMYGSTMVALEALHPRLSPGGYCIIDDYHAVPACRQAVQEYRQRCGITAPLQEIDTTGVYWRLPKS